jgi:outer membrane protein OmpA-like peptidoglycan-associated protein
LIRAILCSGRENNLRLSLQRATAVAEHLVVRHQIAYAQIWTAARGHQSPLDNVLEGQKNLRNRRAELRFVCNSDGEESKLDPMAIKCAY